MITDIVRGGEEITSTTIQRFFALHVVILPLLYLPVLGLHLWLVQKHGNALPPSEVNRPSDERRTIRFFPDFFAKDMGMWLLMLNVLAILASLFPWQLGPQADEINSAPAGIHPEWYFMSPFQLLKVFGRWLPGAAGEFTGIGLFTACIIVWLLIPFVDPDGSSGKRAKLAIYIGLVFLFGLIGTTIWGYWDL